MCDSKNGPTTRAGAAFGTIESAMTSSSHSTCIICLSSLLCHPTSTAAAAAAKVTHQRGIRLSSNYTEDDVCSVGDNVEEDNEIGVVVPCGHVFHIKCWQQWAVHARRCPSCNQDAGLFCRLFISAPPLPTPCCLPSDMIKPPIQEILITVPSKSNTFQQVLEDEDEERQILLDMRFAEQQGPARAIHKIVSLKSEIRRIRRASSNATDELESTKQALELTQRELQMANLALESQTTKVLGLNDKLTRLQTLHWQRHQILHEELTERHTRQVTSIQKELDQVKAELAFRNRQLAQWTGYAMGGSPGSSNATGSDPTSSRILIPTAAPDACRGSHREIIRVTGVGMER
jgi:Ring finger domain